MPALTQQVPTTPTQATDLVSFDPSPTASNPPATSGNPSFLDLFATEPTLVPQTLQPVQTMQPIPAATQQGILYKATRTYA